MRAEERFCTNCREPLAARAAWCEKCGADAGDVFDGRLPRQKSSAPSRWLLILVLIAGAGVTLFLYRPQWFRRGPTFDSGPIRVVGQRPGGTHRAPGAKLSQPEAVRALRNALVANKDLGIKSECLAVASRGFKDGVYLLEAVDSCNRSNLGRWRVDGTTGEVRQ